MVTIIVLINIFISISLLYLAQKIRKLKRNLAFVADRLNQYEYAIYTTLHTLPDSIYLGQEKIHHLRLENQKFQQQIQQLRQIFSLILLVKQIYQGSLWLPISKINKEKSS